MRKDRFIKSFAKGMCAVVMTAVVAAPLTACNHTGISNENTPLTLASEALDTVFNPFFYTSGADGDIVSQTQIGMLASNERGDIVSGWDEACVSLDHSYYTVGTKDDMQGPNDYSHFYSDYYFAIKDNLKFSDGVDLTADDVLFNLYMYLDPAYTGSSTIYSVDIQGLKQYRTQSTNEADIEASDSYFNNLADTRISAIIDWALDEDSTWSDASFAGYESLAQLEPGTIENDILKAHDLFKDELNTDWTYAQDAVDDYEKYKDRNGQKLITEGWQVFLYQYGLYNIDVDQRAEDKSILNYKLTTNGYTGKEYTQDAIVQFVHNSFVAEYEDAEKEYKENLVSIITGYATASTLRSYVLSAVIRDELKGNMIVPTITGVEILENQSSIPTGVDSNRALRDADGNIASYDVLHIKINGLDPKAIQNFAFTVAPGHHYSSVWSNRNDANNNIVNGVKFADPDFMEEIRQNHVPLGAGPYRVSKEGGTAETDKLVKGDFWKDNIVYMERNEHFCLGVPKIKMLRYKVINNNMLYDAVKNNEVHFATPNVTADTVNKKLMVEDKNILHYTDAPTLGYGYIGISAQYINNIYVRRAIMTTLDPQMCVTYYGGNDYAEIIRRPMSKTLENYYPTDAGAYYEFDQTGDGVDYWLQYAHPVTNSDGSVSVDGKKLKFTFTIAGDSTDHPANSMLENSAEILRKKGFDITVTHDSTALSKLANGQLTVWAAAWSSSSDPDMYQVYHKNSNATSTKAWGYSYLTSAACDANQRQLVEDLSILIEEGREAVEVEERRPIYLQALDKLMELAVEFPTYQRHTFYVWRANLFDESTMYTGSEVSAYRSPLSEIWNVSFKEN